MNSEVDSSTTVVKKTNSVSNQSQTDIDAQTLSPLKFLMKRTWKTLFVLVLQVIMQNYTYRLLLEYSFQSAAVVIILDPILEYLCGSIHHVVMYSTNIIIEKHLKLNQFGACNMYYSYSMIASFALQTLLTVFLLIYKKPILQIFLPSEIYDEFYYTIRVATAPFSLGLYIGILEVLQLEKQHFVIMYTTLYKGLIFMFLVLICSLVKDTLKQEHDEKMLLFLSITLVITECVVTITYSVAFIIKKTKKSKFKIQYKFSYFMPFRWKAYQIIAQSCFQNAMHLDGDLLFYLVLEALHQCKQNLNPQRFLKLRVGLALFRQVFVFISSFQKGFSESFRQYYLINIQTPWRVFKMIKAILFVALCFVLLNMFWMGVLDDMISNVINHNGPDDEIFTVEINAHFLAIPGFFVIFYYHSKELVRVDNNLIIQAFTNLAMVVMEIALPLIYHYDLYHTAENSYLMYAISLGIIGLSTYIYYYIVYRFLSYQKVTVKVAQLTESSSSDLEIINLHNIVDRGQENDQGPDQENQQEVQNDSVQVMGVKNENDCDDFLDFEPKSGRKKHELTELSAEDDQPAESPKLKDHQLELQKQKVEQQESQNQGLEIENLEKSNGQVSDPSSEDLSKNEGEMENQSNLSDHQQVEAPKPVAELKQPKLFQVNFGVFDAIGERHEAKKKKRKDEDDEFAWMEIKK